jgi:hypothetical protein
MKRLHSHEERHKTTQNKNNFKYISYLVFKSFSEPTYTKEEMKTFFIMYQENVGVI